MPQPCEQAEVIAQQGILLAEIRKGQKEQKEAHSRHAAELKESITKMTEVLVESTKHSAEIDQLKRETNLLFEQDRHLANKVDAIEIRNARCDGAGIFDNFPKMWNWYQQEQGWRRFLPTFMAFLAWIASLWAFFRDS